MLTKNKTAAIIIQVLIWLLAIVSTAFLLRKTSAGAVLPRTETVFMFIEILIVGLWLFAALFFIHSVWLSGTVMAIVAYVYLWLHRIALPVLISGLYVLYLIIAGEALLNILAGDRQEDRLKRICHDFIAGAALHISVVGLLSAFGIGGVVCSRVVSVSLLVISAVYIGVIRFSKKRVSFPMTQLPDEKELKREAKSRIWICIALALTGSMLLLQAGRINIALDYDSLHYGLRSRYVLDAGHGIYENLGSVNDVYVYPKGLETLVLPLVTDVTYGFVLSFSWWMSCGILICIYGMVRKLNSRRAGIYAAAFASTIPGIMNMGISAKTDVITVLVQLIAISDLADEDYVWAGSALLLSLIFKPTSLMFSGLLFITALVYIIVKKKKINLRRWYVSIPVICAFCFISARTLILTGLPITAAASRVWETLGFVRKYPFNSVDAFGTPEGVNLIKRIIGFFFCPATDDLFHVYIAWGGIGTAILLFFGFILKGDRFIKILTAVILSVSVVCIFTLYQVDGNYFMLLYAMAAIMFFSSPIEIYRILIPVIIMNVMMCGVTNWSGAIGLTPAKFRHLGFYDHESDSYDRLIAEGNKSIYDYLARDRRQRVIAFADQPGCLEFKCNVQSYTDIEGSGGNVYLVKTLDLFKEFMDYAGTDYIYVNDSFLENHSRASDIITYMIEDGSLKEMIDEGSNRLYEYIQE